jgi:hypothetical protein
MSKYFKVNNELLEELNMLTSLPPEELVHVVENSILDLEGENNFTDHIEKLSARCRIQDPNALRKLTIPCGTLLWELTTAAFTTSTQVYDVLTSIGLPKPIVEAFADTYFKNRRRLVVIKGKLGVSTRHYENLSWRLDMELARRNVYVSMEPRYSLRLDVRDGYNGDKVTSKHFTASYANLSKVCEKLQTASDQLQSQHCERFTRYIT